MKLHFSYSPPCTLACYASATGAKTGFPQSGTSLRRSGRAPPQTRSGPTPTTTRSSLGCNSGFPGKAVYIVRVPNTAASLSSDKNDRLQLGSSKKIIIPHLNRQNGADHCLTQTTRRECPRPGHSGPFGRFSCGTGGLSRSASELASQFWDGYFSGTP